MSVIGDQIKKYRIANGITQEQLGQLIGVTTQGVSRWERGGTPDAEILPRLSEVLGVSIDSLFGREDQSFSVSLAKQLSRMSQKEAYRYAMNICWAIEVGLLGNDSIIDDFMNRIISKKPAVEGAEKENDSRIIQDSGISNLYTANDYGRFFLMMDPNGRMKAQLSDFESLRKAFALFSDENILRIMLYLCSMPEMPVSSALISKSTKLNQQTVDRCMDILCQYSIVFRTEIATDSGDIEAYTFRSETQVLPLICLADEIAKKDIKPFFGCITRKNPLL